MPEFEMVTLNDPSLRSPPPLPIWISVSLERTMLEAVPNVRIVLGDVLTTIAQRIRNARSFDDDYLNGIRLQWRRSTSEPRINHFNIEVQAETIAHCEAQPPPPEGNSRSEMKIIVLVIAIVIILLIMVFSMIFLKVYEMITPVV